LPITFISARFTTKVWLILDHRGTNERINEATRRGSASRSNPGNGFCALGVVVNPRLIGNIRKDLPQSRSQLTSQHGFRTAFVTQAAAPGNHIPNRLKMFWHAISFVG
jgi:hypothetical protein